MFPNHTRKCFKIKDAFGLVGLTPKMLNNNFSQAQKVNAISDTLKTLLSQWEIPLTLA